MADCLFKVIDGKIHMRLLLLCPGGLGPNGRFMLCILLEQDARVCPLCLSRRADTCEFFIMKRDFPTEKRRIKFCQFIRVPAIQRKRI